MKKFLAGGALTAVALGGMVAMAPAASAHIPSVSADCTGVYADLKMYKGGTDVEVAIDGVVVESAVLPGSAYDWVDFVKHYSFDDDTVSHTWSVTVDAHDDDQFDRSFGGTVEACAAPPTKEVVVPATPEAVAGCAVTVDDVVLPESTKALTYSKNDAGVVAALASDDYEWIEDLGSWTVQDDMTALFPADLLLVEEKCEEEPPAPSPTPSEPEPTTPASPSAPATPSTPADPAAEEPPVLAATGATVGGAAAFALLLVGGGIALVVARKRLAKN